MEDLSFDAFLKDFVEADVSSGLADLISVMAHEAAKASMRSLKNYLKEEFKEPHCLSVFLFKCEGRIEADRLSFNQVLLACREVCLELSK